MRRNLIKPYGYQQSFSAAQLEELQKALWGKPESYLNFADSPVLSFFNLTQMDNLLHDYLDKGHDITPLISIADWCDSSFKTSRLMSGILEKSHSFKARYGSYVYHMDNAKLLLENFLLYSVVENPADIRYTQQVHHEVIPEFCKKMIYAYNYFDSVNDSIGKEKSYALFEQTLDMTKNMYEQDKKYWSSRATVLVSEVLLTRKKISLSYPLLEKLLPEIDMKLMWDSYGSMVKNKLFKVPLGTDSFKIVEHILCEMEDTIVDDIKKSFSYHNELENIEKIVYYLDKHWAAVTVEESTGFAQRFFKLNNHSQLENDLVYLVPLMKHIEPFEKISAMFDKPHCFSESIRKSQGFAMCHEELNKRKLYTALESTLEQKDAVKQKKI